MRHLPALLLLALPLSALAQTLPPPPPTSARPVVDNYFGTKITDAYRWLENRTDPEVQSWFKAQGQYARTYLDALPDRDQLAKDMTKYVNSAPATVTHVARTIDGRYFIEKTLPSQNTPKLYTRASLTAPETLLVDPDNYAANGQPAAINYFTPSTNGRYVAVGISVGGSEDSVIHTFDVATTKELSDTIDRCEYGNVQWLPDNQSFCYIRLQKLPPHAAEIQKYMDPITYLHRLNTDPETDHKILYRGADPAIPMTDVDSPAILLSPDCPYAVAAIQHGVQNEETIYAAPLATLDQPNVSWTKICDVDDKVVGVFLHGEDLFLLSHKDAPHFRILKTSLAQPQLARTAIFLPTSDAIVHDLAPAADALYIRQFHNGAYHLLRAPYDGAAPTELPLPFPGDASFLDSDPRIPGILFTLNAWTKGPRICQYDPTTDAITTTDIAPAGPYDNRDDLVSEDLQAPSYDGALVPLTLIHKKDLQRNGKNPVYMRAYGAYGLTADPAFFRNGLPWIDRGGIFAIAHVRGGGELGQDWYKAGYKLTKPNTWRDTIACAQFLIDQHYSSTPYLGISGGSAGGITMSRSMTERPDLFGAVCIQVGCCNSLRMEQTANGPNNIPEFGSTQTLPGFEDSLAMDGTQHVRPNTPYPATLLTTGMNDPRVDSWEPGKMAAHLQAASSSGKPILLRVDFAAGHGIGSSKQQRINELADIYAFFLHAFAENNAAPK